MASETTTGSNIDIVREYTERVFNQHSPDLAAKYRCAGTPSTSTALPHGFKANRRGRSQVVRIAVAGQGKASGGLAATGAAPISFADLASKSASARK